MELCSLTLKKFCAKQLQDRIPIEALDFTMKLPRVLSLYIFSFLDPRSLCRCAQVKKNPTYAKMREVRSRKAKKETAQGYNKAVGIQECVLTWHPGAICLVTLV